MKQSPSVKTLTKHVTHVMAKTSLAKRQSSTLLHEVVRRISRESCTNVSFWFLPKGQEQSSCSFFHEKKGRSIGTWNPLLFLGLKEVLPYLLLTNIFVLSCFPDLLQTQIFQWKLKHCHITVYILVSSVKEGENTSLLNLI